MISGDFCAAEKAHKNSGSSKEINCLKLEPWKEMKMMTQSLHRFKDYRAPLSVRFITSRR